MAIENLITDHLDLWTTAVRPKSSAGRGNNSKLELTGIKKLRELILELAVRGKLVPQDPSDEPASVLLERIAAEKVLLVKEGKIKKPKALPEISKEDKPFELPEGWEWSMLAEIAAINPRNEIDDAVDASFVPMSLISTAYNGQHEFEARKWGEIKKGFTHFANGDIGIAKITPCFENSKAAIFSGLINGVGAGTTELHIARPYTDYVSALFILLNIKSPIYLKKGEAGMTGTAGQKRLAKDFFSLYPLPIPPFAEQHRIVAKVDELMALCDRLELLSESQSAAHQTLVEALLATLTDSTDADELAQNWARLSTHFDTLFTTEASIDALKQTILQLAVMGKLVPQDPSDEPASALLERIAAEKAQLVKEKKIKKERPLPAISEDEKPFELPTGWEWCRIGDFSKLISGKGFKKSEYSEKGVRLFQIANVSLGYTKWEVENFMPMDYLDLYPELKLSSGDVLIALNRPLLNKRMKICILSANDIPAILYQRVGKFEFDIEKINAKYLYYFMQSSFFIEHLHESLQGSDQPFINQSQLVRFLFPYPPLDEQIRIINKIDELMALCEQLKARQQTSQQTQLALAESLVEGALA